MIAEAEANYERQLSMAAAAILSDEKIQIVTVTGPTCSGKTTTSDKLTAALEAAGRSVYMVSFDDFYKNRAELPLTETGRVDYDTAASLDLETLYVCLDRLVREESVDLPKYDFHTGTRVGVVRYTPRDDDIILLEGIQAMYPCIRAHLPHDVTRSVAILPDADAVASDGTVITRREVRLLRRIVRDARTRNADAEKTLSMWEDVLVNENANIFPYFDQADIHINSYLSYEIHIIREPAEALLSAVPPESAYRSMADDLCRRLSAFAAMPSDGVPMYSVFREFIGGK